MPATRSRSAEVAPHRGGGRVVQLVGQAGRQRAEGQQPLPLADRLLGVLVAEEQPLQQVHRHREPFGHQLRRSIAASSTKKRDGPSPAASCCRSAGPARPGRPGTRRRRHRAAEVRFTSMSSAPTRREQHDRALEQHVEAGGRVALGVDEARLEQLDAALARTASSSWSSVSFSNRNSVRSSAGSHGRRHVRAGRLQSQLLQVTVHEHDGHRALADGGGDPLGRLGADVAGDEHAGHAGLQVVRRRGRAAIPAAAHRQRPGRARPARSRGRPACTTPSSQSVSGAAPMKTNSHSASTSSVVAGRRCRAASAPPGGRRRAALDHLGAGAHA